MQWALFVPELIQLSMAEFEEKYINLLDKNMSMLYLQYIGDIFMLWKSNYGI